MKSILSHLFTLPLLMLAADTGGATATAPGPVKGGAKGGPAPAPAPGGPAPTPTTTTGTAPQPTPHPKLLEAIKGYDNHVKEAETYYVQMIELVLEHKISRADVVATLMKARGISFESAQSQYSRMKNIWSDPTILQKLKNGEITLKVAREATTKKQNNPAGGGTEGDGSTGAKTATTETKEARYERARKAHVAAVKECGFEKKSALMSFEADLTAAQIK